MAYKYGLFVIVRVLKEGGEDTLTVVTQLDEFATLAEALGAMQRAVSSNLFADFPEVDKDRITGLAVQVSRSENDIPEVTTH